MNKLRPKSSWFRRTMAAMMAAAALVPGVARASTIVNQPNNAAPGDILSQTFTDMPSFSTHSFDDFSTTQSFTNLALNIFGTELGNPAANLSVVGEIWNGLPGTGSLVLTSTSGTESGANLSISFGAQTLSAGNYWISAYVVRPISSGGQWFWNESSPVTGSQAFVYNPGGSFGHGTAPVGLSPAYQPAPHDLAFTLSGDPADVPEIDPGSAAATFSALACAVTMLKGRRAA
jgi:hypothetical protein